MERLTKPGIYSDGGGLYLRVRNSGNRSWLYVCWLNGRRREQASARCTMFR
ncbi:Arm DNA-binding domain-containing protein [Sphingobium sp. B11D3A]|uniref:Arm DNA-binding domain-containing protein n=1 Tax=unclassified Sphingobium TaxID=2611147 RepID=UPI0039B5BC6F